VRLGGSAGMILGLMNAHRVDLGGVSVVRWGKVILSDVSLAVPAGGCCAILGPNGSGKSTLLAILSGYLWPTRGSVEIGGQVYGKVDLARVRQTIGLIEPSRSPEFDRRMRVRHVVATGLFGTIRLPLGKEVSVEQMRRVQAELGSFGLAGLGDNAFAELSTGEQMKALVARALVAEAGLLLLDEPTAGLDLGARAACIGVLDRLLNRPDHPTVIIVTHHLDELPRLVDQVVLLKEGGVLEQGPAEQMLTSEKLSTLFDCRVEVFRSNGRYIAGVSDGSL
jgi:iron complex transport system ATP-binding protein